MREILFRGKRIDNGEWVEGSLFLDEEDAYISRGADFPIWKLCDPSTIGQYTGLTDKNGKRIFEGDIVEGHCHSAWSHRLQRCEVAYSRDGFVARNYIYGIGTDYYTYRVLFSKDVVVIGNIHDNPELLKQGDADGV